MIGIDTNVLVRFIVQDDAAQAALAADVLERRCTVENLGYVNLVVLCELAWVLAAAYGYSRAQVALALRQVLVTQCLEVQEHALAWAAVEDYAAGAADFADFIIGRLNQARGVETTVTFDRRAARSRLFTLLAAPTSGGGTAG